MTQATERRDGIVSSRSCLIAILIALLIFPPSMFGDQIGWSGSSGAYTDSTWTCSSCDPNDGATFPANGQTFGGGAFGPYTYDASIHTGTVSLDLGTVGLSLEQGIDAVTLDSMSIRGATLNVTDSVGGSLPLTLGNPLSAPSNSYGSVLSVGNGGTLSIAQNANLKLDLSGGGGSINHPGAPNSVGAYIGTGGSISLGGGFPVASGGTLLVQNSFGGTRAFVNNGSINAGSGATLQFSNQGASGPVPGSFVLTGSGAVNLGGFVASIAGTTGTESLINDFGHTINASGGLNFISNLGSFTNNGTLAVGTGTTLEVADTLGNYDTATGRLTNGSYSLQSGSTLLLSSIGSGNSISSLNLANVQLVDKAVLTGGSVGPPAQRPSGQGPNVNTGSWAALSSAPSAVAGLNHLTDGNLDLQGVSTTITPTNGSGTLYLRSDPLGIPTNLTVEQDSHGNGSNVEIAGSVKNVSSVYNAPQQSPLQTFGAVNENPGTTIPLGGSSINVSGSTLTIDKNLNNQAYGTPFSSLSPSLQQAYSSINVINGGTLNVGNPNNPSVPGNLVTHTNFNGNSYINIDGYDDNNNLTGATVNVSGNLRNGGGFGNPLSQGADIITLGDGTLNVGGNFTNNNSGYQSLVYVDGNSKVNVGGWFGQFQGNSGSGFSGLYVNGGQMTVGNLRNSTGASNANTPFFSPQSGIIIDQGGSLQIGSVQNNGTFANLSSGTLSGGSYYVGGPAGPSGPAASLSYYGVANTGINTIDYNTALTLDDGGSGSTGQIRNLNNTVSTDALSGYLTTVNGSLTLNNSAQLNLPQALTIGANANTGAVGQLTLAAANPQLTSGGSLLTATGLTLQSVTNGSTTYNAMLDIEQGNTVDVRNGGSGVLGNLNGGTLTGGNWTLNGQLLYGVGMDLGTNGAQAITALSGVTMSLGKNGGIAYGTTGSNNTDALQTLNSVGAGSNLTINGQSRSFGPLNVDSSTLSLANNAKVTFNGPSGPSGDGLSLTNGAAMNVTGSTATLNLAGGNTASITGSSLNINDGGTLVLAGGGNSNPAGVVNVNAGGTLNLQALSNGPGGVLSVNDGGAYQINGSGNVTNFGTISVSKGSLLTINASMTSNLVGGGTLSGGSYIIGNGSTLQLSGIGADTSLSTLEAANVSITGSGLLTGGSPPTQGPGNGPQVQTTASSTLGSANALAQLSELNGATLSLINAGSVTITPGTGTFLVDNAIDAGTPGTLNLRQGTNLQLNGNFEAENGNLNITNGSKMTVGGSFNNIDGSGNFGVNLNTANSAPINLLVGSGSTLTYTGADITSIANGSSLTLGNREGASTKPWIVNLADTTPGNTKQDALSYSLNTVNGTLSLQNGASLQVQAAATSFTNNGQVNITGGSAQAPTTLDVSNVTFNNVDGSGNLTGKFLVGRNSVLNYSGANISNIDGNLTLDNTNGSTSPVNTTGTITNKGSDALSASLTSVGLNNLQEATLTLQNNANLTLTGAQTSFTNLGVVSIMNRSTFDVSKLTATTAGSGTGFLDIDSNGNMNGNYFISSGSRLNYSGASGITAINGTLTLDNVNNGVTGMITNAGSEALSGSLAAINGAFGIQNNATLELSSSSGVTVVNMGALNIDQGANPAFLPINQFQGGSTLTVDNKLTNYNGFVNVGSLSNAAGSTLNAIGGLSNKSDDSGEAGGQAFTRLVGSNLTVGQLANSQTGTPLVTSNLFNGAFTPNGGTANAEIDLGYSSNATVTGNVKNVATLGFFDGGPSTTATINLYGSSNLQVNGGFTNYSGASTGLAALYLSDNSTATVMGLFTNSGGSLVDLDDPNVLVSNLPNDGNTGFSTLTANGGFNNHNSQVLLNNASSLNVAGGFRNLSDDSSNSNGGSGNSLLQIGGSGLQLLNNAQGPVLQTGKFEGGFASVATITGGLVNSAATSNGGSATSAVTVASGSFLNVDNLTNSAMAATPGQSDSAVASLTLGTFFAPGGSLNITGNLTNSASVPQFQNGSSNGSATAQILSYGGSLTVGGSVTNSAAINANGNASAAIVLDAGSTATVKGTFTNTSGFLLMNGGSTATVAGFFTNDSNSNVTLENNEFNKQGVQSPGLISKGSVNTNPGETTLNVTGEFDNAGSVSIGSGSALNVLEDGNSDPSTYKQTGGTTILTVGGTLSGDKVNILGGTMQGNNDGSGPTSATVDGYLTIGSDGSEAQGTQTATLNLGDPMSIDVVGTYDQTTLGILELSLDGVGLNDGSFEGSDDSNNAYDQVDVSGNVHALDGTLELNLESGFTDSVSAGEYFNILNWTGSNAEWGGEQLCPANGGDGCFGAVNIVGQTPGNLTFSDSQGNLYTFIEEINKGDQGTELDLYVESFSASATPEPGTLSMLFCSMLIGGGVTWYRRRRKNVAA